MNWRNYFRVGVSILFLGGSLFAGGAFAADPAELFTAVPALQQFGVPTPSEPAVSRSRLVRLNTAATTAADGGTVHALRLNLFPDRDFIMEVDRERTSGSGARILRGHVPDRPASAAIFVEQNGVTAGLVQVPGEGVFQIRYQANGVHRIVELDPATMPQCGVTSGFTAQTRALMESVATQAEEPPAEADSSNGDSTTQSSSAGTAGVPTPQDTPKTVVDIMIVYTNLSRDGAGGVDGIETLAQLAIEEANLCFDNSQINLELNLVNIQMVSYTETGNIEDDLYNLAGYGTQTIPNLENQRKFQYKADLVSMFTEREDSGTIAGIAFIMQDVNNANNINIPAFSVIRRAYAVGNYTFAHEVGHNLGCAHDIANSGGPGAFAYSYGERFFAQGNTYATVMTYPPGIRIPYFSNPNVSYLGTPTGVAQVTDNAATINYTAPNVTSKFLTALRRYSFVSTTYAGNEGTGSVAITVKRVGTSTTSAMTIEYATENGTAIAGQDYVASNGLVTFASGETEKSFVVSLINDNTSERPETFKVRLTNPKPIATSGLGNPELATVTINDDENAFYWANSSMSFSESQGQIALPVVRGGATNITSQVAYSVTGGTALIGQDVVAGNGTLVFQPGEAGKSILLNLIDDLDQEPDETFTVTLSNPTGGATLIAPAAASVTIRDDDRPGAIVPYVANYGAANDIVYSVAARPDGRILVAGRYSQIGGRVQAGIAQLNPDGSVDPTFDPGIGVEGSVLAVALLPDGRVVLGGEFTAVNGVTRGNIAVLKTDGSVDPAFNPGTGTSDAVRGLAIDGQGRILVGGFFNSFNGSLRNFLIRLTNTGALDGSFTTPSGLNGPVRSIAVDSTGRIIIGGDFTPTAGLPNINLARLTANGAFDSTFLYAKGADARVRAVAVDSMDRVLVGGEFASVASQTARYLARVTAAGTFDGTFNVATGPNAIVYGLAVQPDNKVLVVGDFTSVKGSALNRIARLNADGQVDATFNPGSGANALVWSAATDPSGKVHIGGEFTLVNGETRHRVASLRFSPNLAPFDPVIREFTAANLVGGQVTVSFDARPGTRYALDRAQNPAGSWTAVITNTASSAVLDLIDPAPALDRRFYRIRQVSP